MNELQTRDYIANLVSRHPAEFNRWTIEDLGSDMAQGEFKEAKELADRCIVDCSCENCFDNLRGSFVGLSDYDKKHYNYADLTGVGEQSDD